MNTKKTPFGDECIGSIDPESRLGEMILNQAKGSWQKEVCHYLLDQGYIIGYLATGKLRGKAKRYQGHYAKSLENLTTRIYNQLKFGSNFSLISGSVGPKGAFGYYIVE